MDYKHRIPDYRRRPARKKNRSGYWVAIALVAGLAAAAVGWTFMRPKDSAESEQTESTMSGGKSQVALPGSTAKPGEKKLPKSEVKPASKPTQERKPAAPNLPEPRFTFYKILPEKESIIPESEIKNLKQEESLGKQAQTVQYMLQAGSFTNVQDAEKMKARLSALKIKSHIENVKIENAGWNRVRIGPFTSLAAADGVRTLLRKNQIDSVVQKSLNNPPKAAGR